MEMVKKKGLNEVSQQVALLHDICEMTPVTVSKLREIFGDQVARMVDALSKPPKSDFQAYKRQIVANYERIQVYLQKMAHGIEQDPEVIIIKVCDQLDNHKTLELFQPHDFFRILYTLSHCFIPFYHHYRNNLPKKINDVFLPLLDELESRIEAHCTMDEMWKMACNQHKHE